VIASALLESFAFGGFWLFGKAMGLG